MPQYMLLIYEPEDLVPDPAEMPRWMAVTEELRSSGAHVAGEALQGPDTATTVQVRDGETLITDGPFAETKELLAGFYIVDAPDAAGAEAWAAKLPTVARGSVEVRPVMQYPAEVQ
jgi:hypothetical protein